MNLKLLAKKKWPYRLLNVIGILVFILVVANIFMVKQNQSLRIEINERQQFINQSIRLSRLNTEIIKSLARLAAAKNDEQLKELLVSHGITFTVTAKNPDIDQ